MFESLVAGLLGDLKGDVAKKLLGELENVGKDYAANTVSKQAGRVLVKGIDEVVERAVKVLDKAEQTEEFVESYVDQMDGEWVELLDAIKAYIPLQVAVEVAKKKHGKNSAEANAARAKRKAGIEEVHEEVRDVFAGVLGGTITD
jgi:hypothetical protein